MIIISTRISPPNDYKITDLIRNWDLKHRHNESVWLDHHDVSLDEWWELLNVYNEPW